MVSYSKESRLGVHGLDLLVLQEKDQQLSKAMQAMAMALGLVWKNTYDTLFHCIDRNMYV